MKKIMVAFNNNYFHVTLSLVICIHVSLISQEGNPNEISLSCWQTIARHLKPRPSVDSTPLTCAQKIKKTAFNCCMPKISKLACAYCCCGKSCTQTVQSFAEYKLGTTIIPLLHNPYCLGGTITACSCILCITALYKTNTFYGKEKTPSNNLSTMNYNENQDEQK